MGQLRIAYAHAGACAHRQHDAGLTESWAKASEPIERMHKTAMRIVGMRPKAID